MVVCICYKLYVLEWLNSCHAEVWLAIYSGFLSPLLIFFKIKKKKKSTTLLSSEFLCWYLFVYQPFSKIKAVLFLHFQTFCCATCDYSSVTCIIPSTSGSLNKAMPVKRGKGNTKTYGIIYIEQSVCNAVCEQRWISAVSVSATGRNYFMDFSLTRVVASWTPQFHEHWAIPTDVTNWWYLSYVC